MPTCLQDRWSHSELLLYCGSDASSGDDSTPNSPPSPKTAANLLAWERVRQHTSRRAPAVFLCALQSLSSSADDRYPVNSAVKPQIMGKETLHHAMSPSKDRELRILAYGTSNLVTNRGFAVLQADIFKPFCQQRLLAAQVLPPQNAWAPPRRINFNFNSNFSPSAAVRIHRNPTTARRG